MEYKSLPSFTKSIEGRSVTGIFCVHGNRDSYGDISHPGSFAKTLAERVPAGKVKFLWMHNPYMVAPAVIRSAREVNRSELPEAVVQMAPDATGGVEVVREYLKTPAGDELLTAVEAGAINEMSYGFDTIQWDMSEVNGEQVRNLREVRLWDISDVTWGANEATVGSKHGMPIELFMKQLESFMNELKAGARHSTADTKLLNAIHKAALELGATNCKGLVDEDEKAAEDAADTDEQKSRAAVEALTLLKSELDILELQLA